MLTTYTLDRRDRIIEVSPGWDDFALDNDGEGACADHVVGTRLVDAIAGDPVRMYMTAILMRVRTSGQAEAIPYRCDSETTKRRYIMTLEPLAEGRVRVIHQLDSEESTDLIIRVRPARVGERAPLRCSICCRIREGGIWIDPFAQGRNRNLRIIHSICEDCKQVPLMAYRRRRQEPDQGHAQDPVVS